MQATVLDFVTWLIASGIQMVFLVAVILLLGALMVIVLSLASSIDSHIRK